MGFSTEGSRYSTGAWVGLRPWWSRRNVLLRLAHVDHAWRLGWRGRRRGSGSGRSPPRRPALGHQAVASERLWGAPGGCARRPPRDRGSSSALALGAAAPPADAPARRRCGARPRRGDRPVDLLSARPWIETRIGPLVLARRRSPAAGRRLAGNVPARLALGRHRLDARTSTSAWCWAYAYAPLPAWALDGSAGTPATRPRGGRTQRTPPAARCRRPRGPKARGLWHVSAR